MENDGEIPFYIVPLPSELRDMVTTAVEEAGDIGITTAGLKRKCAGNAHYSKLIDMAISQMVRRGELAFEKRSASGGGRGRPRQVLIKNKGDGDGQD